MQTRERARDTTEKLAPYAPNPQNGALPKNRTGALTPALSHPMGEGESSSVISAAEASKRFMGAMRELGVGVISPLLSLRRGEGEDSGGSEWAEFELWSMLRTFL